MFSVSRARYPANSKIIRRFEQEPVHPSDIHHCVHLWIDLMTPETEPLRKTLVLFQVVSIVTVAIYPRGENINILQMMRSEQIHT